MGEVIGEVLPLALGIAISPVPVIAVILMLLSPKARVASVGLLIGWILGIVVAVTVFTLLSSLLPEQDADASKPIQGIIRIVLGVLLLVLAARQWRKRPRDGADPERPKWMQAIDRPSFVTVFGLGILLSALNPKVLLMAAGAGLDIGSAGLDVGEIVGVIAIFAAFAASTVLVPVVGYLIAANALGGPLDRLRVWLGRENHVIMAVLLLVIGVVLIGKGIAAF